MDFFQNFYAYTMKQNSNSSASSSENESQNSGILPNVLSFDFGYVCY